MPESVKPQTWAIVVWGLFVAAIFSLALTALLGVIVAYVKRPDLAGTAYHSHMTSAIRTFWTGLIVGILGSLLSVIGIGILILIALAVWVVFRVVRGLIRALDGRPIEHPAGWL